MAHDVVIKPVSNLTNENSALQTLNENFAAIVEALQHVLSTTQTSENTMNVSLDMNSQKIINLAPATLANDVTTKGYVDDEIKKYVTGLVDEIAFVFVEREAPESTEPFYVFTQAAPATTWTIHHNLNTYPAVTLFDAAGNNLFATYRYVDTNNVEVTFATATAGKAYLK